MSLFIYFALFISVFIMGVISITFAPWVPCRRRDLDRIIRLADLRAGDNFYDLGCGNGRVAFHVAKKTQARVTGIELAPPLYLICVLRRFINRRKNVTFVFSDLFRADLSRADVVYVFGTDYAFKHRFKAKLERELKPDARVISYAFPITGWKPETVDKPGERDVAIYRYRR